MEVQNVEIGQIYRIKANEQNDITPKDGLLFRAKYIVVIGFDSQGNVYGGVVFDSEINRGFISSDFVDFFLPIPCSRPVKHMCGYGLSASFDGRFTLKNSPRSR